MIVNDTNGNEFGSKMINKQLGGRKIEKTITYEYAEFYRVEDLVRLEKIASSHLVDALVRENIKNCLISDEIRPLVQGKKVVGPAARNLHHKEWAQW